MFYDFVDCYKCKHYDKDRRYCNLFLTTMVNGCACGEEPEENKQQTTKGENND